MKAKFYVIDPAGWIVSDDDGNPLSFDTREDATEEAIERAGDNPGDEFIVAAGIAVVQTPVGDAAVTALE